MLCCVLCVVCGIPSLSCVEVHMRVNGLYRLSMGHRPRGRGLYTELNNIMGIFGDERERPGELGFVTMIG